MLSLWIHTWSLQGKKISCANVISVFWLWEIIQNSEAAIYWWCLSKSSFSKTLIKQLGQSLNCFHLEKSNCYPQNSRQMSNLENSLAIRFSLPPNSPPPKEKAKKIMGNDISFICRDTRHWSLQIYWMPTWKVFGDRRTMGRNNRGQTESTKSVKGENSLKAKFKGRETSGA